MITTLVIIGLVFLILVHEFGHFIVARFFHVRVEEFGIGYPPRVWSKMKGGVLWSINALPFGGFVKILGEDGGENDPQSFSRQKIWKRIMILCAGICMNMIAGWIFFSGVYITGSPARAIIMEVKENTPASIAGLKNGDIVIAVSSPTELLKIPNADEFTSFTKRSVEKAITIEVSRSGRTESVSLIPREHPPEGEGALGVVITNAGFEKHSFFSGLWQGFLTTIDVTIAIILGLVSFFANLFSPGAFDSVAGPVGVVKIAADMGKLGLAYVFQIIGLISINLAILNLVPFPALDGGRVLFLIIEKFRGRAVSPKVEQTVNMVGFLALIVLMIVVTFKDVSRLF
ncbi:RIP metalloprotease RseP [Candidatus Parcubacteria bacterium]|jgi:regulator of sigma E protease|nr:MAG: RIP metalloprotease RseP [Candidatus Parcubacteria bacterium]